MKTTKTLLFELSLVLGLCLTLNGCGPGTAKEDEHTEAAKEINPVALTAQTEDIIDLIKHPVDDAVAIAEFKACDDFISVRKVLKLSRDAEEIAIGAFVKLKTMANNSVPAGVNYVTGLKITYGLKPLVAKMDLLYTPIYMFKLRDSLPTGEKWGIYLVVDNPAFYTYSTAIDSFQVTSDDACVEKYRSNIKIDHDGNGGFDDFNPNLDGGGDVRSVIFSFQEIDSIIGKNPNTKSLKVFNASVKIPYNNDTIMKHSLLLGPDSKNPASAPGTPHSGFNDRYANLGHLCPPGCSTVRFQLK